MKSQKIKVRVVSIHYEPHSESFWKIIVPKFNIPINCVEVQLYTRANHKELEGKEVICELGIYCGKAKKINSLDVDEYKLLNSISESAEDKVLVKGKVAEVEDKSHFVLDLDFPLEIQIDHELEVQVGDFVEVTGLATIVPPEEPIPED